MTPLERLRANQNNHLALPSDHALFAFLAETDPDRARLDLAPLSPVEIRHLAHARNAA